MKCSITVILLPLVFCLLPGCGGGSSSTVPTNTTTSGSASGSTTGSSSGTSSATGSSSSSGTSGTGSTTPAFTSQVYDLSADFSLTTNPNGVWQYGYSATSALSADQFRVATALDASNSGVGFWHATSNTNTGVTSGYYPYIAKNTSGMAGTDPTGHWAVRAGEIAMEGSGNGQYSMVRFVAPSAGQYKVYAVFEGIHFNLSTTDVHVLHNAASIFDANIDGYGGDPAFHAIQGPNPNAIYSGDVVLQANDTLTFAIGVGPNQTNFNDTTGLSVHIVTVPLGSTP